MQDIEVMDEHYARAYERCLHLTEKLKVRNDEIAALKLVGSAHSNLLSREQQYSKWNRKVRKNSEFFISKEIRTESSRFHFVVTTRVIRGGIWIGGGGLLCRFIISFAGPVSALQELAETKSQLKDQKKAVSLLQDAGDSSQSQAVEVYLISSSESTMHFYTIEVVFESILASRDIQKVSKEFLLDD